MKLPQEWQDFLREQFPMGSRITVRESADGNVAAGTSGKLFAIDDSGTFYIETGDGSNVLLKIGKDRFSVEQPEAHMLKLYMPLTADSFEPDEYGDMNWEPIPLDARELVAYKDKITAALIRERMPEEAERGVMHWYHEDDGVNRKVRSVVFTAEERNGKLWGVAECSVVGELEPQELEMLKDYITGQASDGWGEGFEQREIKYGDGRQMNVHLWNSHDWSIQTGQECFEPHIAQGLPDMCFSVIKSTGELICIKRGVEGYFPSDWNTPDRERNEELAADHNKHLGVTDAQRQAMECGSMFGWGVPGADPKWYEQHQPQMGGMTLG